MRSSPRSEPWREDLTLNNDAEYFTRVVLASRQVLFCAGARCYYRSGGAGNLSGRRTRAAFRSQEAVLDACETRVLAREDSPRMRAGFAQSWQHFAHACHPYAPDLAERAVARAARLHAIRIRPDGGAVFHVASRLFGWRLARKAQTLSGRP